MSVGYILCSLGYYFHRHQIEQYIAAVGILNWLSGYNVVFWICTVLAYTLFAFRKLITCDHFDYRTEKTFEEFSVEGLTLKYDKHIPILEYTDLDDYYQNGFNHGKYLANYISKYVWKLRVLSLFMKKIDPSKLRINNKYEEEMAGIVDGYNSTGPILKLTYELVLLLNMMPDLNYDSISSLGCSCILGKNLKGDFLFCRNMDWLPYGDMAKYSIVIKNGSVYSLCLPGMVGIVTGWNEQGLVLAMNVCPTYSWEGVPSLFYNREILEKCCDVTDVCRYIRNDKPLICYQLTVADGLGDCCSINFKFFTSDVIRYMRSGKLLAFNFEYDLKEEPIGNHFFSKERLNTANTTLDDSRRDQRTIDALKAIQTIPINNYETCHTVVFEPTRRTVYMAWDNGYAASMPLSVLKY